jgi:hypothetical protein
VSEPTLAQWRALYAAAVAFRDRAPWRWFRDTDLFAVEHPSLDMTGYSTVMGMGGQEFGQAVFLGAAGYAAYRRLMLEEVEPESLEALSELSSLSATFGDRELLDRRDHEVVRSLGLRFRGRGAWPWFRSMRPGYAPWYLEANEAFFLTEALTQAVAVAERVASGALTLGNGLAGEPILTRGFRDGSWHDEWRPAPAPPGPSQDEATTVDEMRLQRLRAAKSPPRGTWLLDIFPMPTPVGARGERPRLPVMLLAITADGLVLGADVLEPSAGPAERQQAIVKLLEQAPALPRAIRVGRDTVERLIAPLARPLGIRVQHGDMAPLHAAQESLFNYLGR